MLLRRRYGRHAPAMAAKGDRELPRAAPVQPQLQPARNGTAAIDSGLQRSLILSCLLFTTVCSFTAKTAATGLEYGQKRTTRMPAHSCASIKLPWMISKGTTILELLDRVPITSSTARTSSRSRPTAAVYSESMKPVSGSRPSILMHSEQDKARPAGQNGFFYLSASWHI